MPSATTCAGSTGSSGYSLETAKRQCFHWYRRMLHSAGVQQNARKKRVQETAGHAKRAAGITRPFSRKLRGRKRLRRFL